MEEFKRAGPPKPIDVRDSIFRLEVPLSGSPPQEWIHFFQDPSEWSSMCHPKLIDVSGRTLEFTSSEAHVERWVKFIDQWIASANARYAQFLEGLRQRQQVLKDEAKERQRRLDEAAARFEKL